MDCGSSVYRDLATGFYRGIGHFLFHPSLGEGSIGRRVVSSVEGD